jgi:dihydroorotate dehydrogenase electron transfer subunit
MSAAGKGLWKAALRRSTPLSPSCSLLVFERPAGFPDAAPGQFVSVRATEATAPLLRRPYSIMDLTGSSLSLLVKAVGRGSAALCAARPGERFDMIGPLGGVPFPEPGEAEAVFVAGGTGLAPVLFAARAWRRRGVAARTTLLCGAATKRELLGDLVKTAFGTRWFATLDGSAGFRGDVVALCRDLVSRGRMPKGVLYSCGPRGMVRALEETTGGHFAAHYTSLEAIMACGVGACRGCTVPVRSGGASVLKAICSDGTVFPAGDILWEEWEE